MGNTVDEGGMSFDEALVRYEAAREAWQTTQAAPADEIADEAMKAYCQAFDTLIRTVPTTKQELAWFIRTVVDELDQQCADSSDELRIAMVTIQSALQKIMPEAYSE
jgi:hypothetical protein